METIITPISFNIEALSPGLKLQHLMRITPIKCWLSNSILADRLSGTLKKNARIGMKHFDQLEHEAICQILGYGFEVMPTSRITFNDAISEGDCSSITETGWHIDRLQNSWPWPEDIFECKYIMIDSGNDIREGVGVVMKETSIQWIGQGKLVFAIIAEFDRKTSTWKQAQNPF